ncbi:MAG: hypothetical protein NTZ17_20855 [Phycisphaerae bacterium]|nr:hypothetical protein [Phycisphaerae bacterium]
MPFSELASGQQTPGPYGVVHENWNWLDVGLNFFGADVTATVGTVVLPVDCIGPTNQTLCWSVPTNWNDAIIPYQRVKEVYDFVTDPGHVNLITTNLGDFSTTIPFQNFMAMGPTETQVSIPIPLQEFGVPATVNIGTRVEFVVTIDGGRNVVLDQDAKVRSLNIGVNSSLFIDNEHYLTIDEAVNNSGTIRKVGLGLWTFDVPFNNSGTLDVQGGVVELTGGGTGRGV